MTTPSPLAPGPLPTWALLLLATSAAAALRLWGGYPLEPSDENNWADIAQAVQQGVAWPISGPLHFEATQALAKAFALTPADALAVLGVLSVPAVLAVYVLAYRWLGFAHASWPLLALGLSTYFWAPLLESRPQQWGQALTLLCIAGAWRLLVDCPDTPQPQSLPASKVQRWLVGSLLFVVLAWVHILSAAITLALGIALSLCLLTLHQTRWQSVLRLGACALPGLLLLTWPEGPYQIMWLDIRHSLLQVPEDFALAVAAGVGAFTTLAMRLARQQGKTLLSALLAHFDAHPRTGMALLKALAGAALGVQAGLLPDQAWHHYQNSALLFVLFQLGNLFFFWLLLRGLHIARQAELARPSRHWACLATLLASASLVAGGLLGVSFFLRDANWLLRFISYALPLAAPFAALALARWWAATPKTARWAWWLLGALSLSVAARPALLFN